MKHLKKTDISSCSFCDINKGHNQFVEATKFFKIIRNRFPYTFWDGQGVADHLMVVPQRHIDSLATLSDEEKIEYVTILQRYEEQSYNVYARAPQSVMKSIVHQHTHLIKTNGTVNKFVLTLRKPLIRIIR
jgi:diadenosine tetraphosphate (Ap4A) HIT family hydrolase